MQTYTQKQTGCVNVHFYYTQDNNNNNNNSGCVGVRIAEYMGILYARGAGSHDSLTLSSRARVTRSSDAQTSPAQCLLTLLFRFPLRINFCHAI